MLKAYKYRIYPNARQIGMIEKTFGVCRLIYNLALETNIRSWQAANKRLSAYDLMYQVPELKKAYPWIAEVDSQAIIASINNLGFAFKGFFCGKGFPKFKKRADGQSFTTQSNLRKIDFDKKTISIPKIHNIKAVISRRFSGEIKNITVSKTQTGKYYASVLVETGEILAPSKKTSLDKIIGIDLGIKSFAVISDGRLFEANRFMERSIERLKCLQRRASRKKKGGNNRKKANLCVAKLHEKIRNQRADYIHKITTILVRDNQTGTIVIEDLNVIGMSRNRNLAGAIRDVSFGEFIRQIKYKSRWYGKNLIQIGMFEPSSKMCSHCETINERLTLADREWTCTNCGVHHDRDLNAAINIRNIGLKKYSGEGISVEPVESRRLRRAMKQEKNKHKK